MSSEMRELVQSVLDFVNRQPCRCMSIAQLGERDYCDRCQSTKNLRALLARTEAGADGVAEPFGYFDSQGLSHAGNSTNFRWLLEQHREGKPNWGNLKLLYTHPQDASGNAEDAARWRHVRKDGLIWRVNMLALAKDDIDILFGAKADAAIDAAMQAKEAK